ncbi:DUF6338 family protein [Prescottella equi]|uniref:DUF6338 family protein n=1 Tax=Rhodococcus hoagii TaxID=43767 RepID=UPI00384D409C
MLATFQALAVLLTSVLPGALFSYGYERQNTRMAIADFNERLMAFLGVSAIFAVASLPLLYEGYRRYVVTGALQQGEPMPGWIWLIVAGYVAIPLLLGYWLGWCARTQNAVGRLLTGDRPHPRAWDALFNAPKLGGYVKIRLKDQSLDNPWVLGLWARGDEHRNGQLRPMSYASAYPHPQDLYLMDTYEIDGDGNFIYESDSDQAEAVPISRGAAIIVRWDEVAYAEFIEA